jgi:16S rRNA (cytosine1402-N4)-methyltransferase
MTDLGRSGFSGDIQEDGSHKPVLLRESIESLNIKPDGVYADMTLGRGGHSAAIAERLDTGMLLCFDRDQDAIDEAAERLAVFGGKVELIKSDFREAAQRLAERGIYSVDGILMDLGVSSPQLDNVERGFSYTRDAPLDMRMDRQSETTAADIVNNWDYDELKRILYEYGEERYAASIASKIVAHRPIQTTLQLAEIIKSAMPAKALREKQHPAKRTFQAIRIAVNDELGALAEALESGEKLLSPGGRIAVITFHSLEDRIVKNFFNEKAKGCVCPHDFPVCVCGRKPILKIIYRKPVLPTEEEIAENPRSRSAKLRVAEKLGLGG